MNNHLSHAILNALADGELSAEQLAGANEHLAECPSCTSKALSQSLLKSATAKAGRRYAPPTQFQEHLVRLASEADSVGQGPGMRSAPLSPSRSHWGFESLGWATAALILLFTVSMMFVERAADRAKVASTEDAALVTEVFDQHVATLAGNMPLQVVSTDRHTVKPWFQGRIPFSFNLPQGLPSDTTLDGANLTYLRNQPVAQLLYSIGKHRVSVFLRQRSGATDVNALLTERSGFHVVSFSTIDLDAIAVSDVDPVRLSELVSSIKHAQAGEQQQPGRVGP
ncbi:MAG: zf-HC2 domain-containing protein [Terracidiphilus sp.]|jgi:anti-sigma factor RsiW